MTAVIIVGTILSSVLIAMAIIAGTIVALARGRRGGFSSREAQASEAQFIQELHDGLSKMEQRVEALETILLDRERKESSK